MASGTGDIERELLGSALSALTKSGAGDAVRSVIKRIGSVTPDEKALTRIAREFGDATKRTTDTDISDILTFLKKNPDAASSVNLMSSIPAGRFTGSGRLSVPTDASKEMSAFAETLISNPRTLAKKDFPKVAKDLGLQPVEGIVYGKSGVIRDVSPKALRQMQQNVESIADMSVNGRVGDPGFYFDGNKLIIGSAPNVDETTAAFTFAPFSAGTAVPENIRRWQRFVENPLLFPGRMPREGGITVGNAWADALRVLGKDAPVVSDLSTGGNVVKVGSFGENLLDPYNSMRATVDRHAVKNAMGLYLPDTVRLPDLQDQRTYAAFEAPFINAAKSRGQMPHEVQSAAWDTWRRLTQANADSAMIDPTSFSKLNVSPIFDMTPAERRSILQDVLGGIYGKDATWMKRAGLA